MNVIKYTATFGSIRYAAAFHDQICEHNIDAHQSVCTVIGNITVAELSTVRSVFDAAPGRASFSSVYNTLT